MPVSTTESLSRDVEELGPWFHNLHLPDGTQTAPRHFLGDFPRVKWNRIAPHIPDDLRGWTALDIGCNAGFYTFELARRGAVVTAIDYDPHYLRQAQWAAEQFELADRVTFRHMQVYELARVEGQFDLVWFMGVLYHLRYPMLGLDIVARKTRQLLVFQTMTMPGEDVAEVPPDLSLNDRDQMLDSGWPKMAFIEAKLEEDPTNWWAPNHACVEAMLRSAGFGVVARPAHEVYLCRPQPARDLGIGPLLDEEYHAAIGQTRPERPS